MPSGAFRRSNPVERIVAKSDNSRFFGHLPKTEIDLSSSMSALSRSQQSRITSGCPFLVHVGHLSTKQLRCCLRYRFAAASGLGAQQRLFDVLRRHGQDLVWQYCVGAAATYEANVAEILPTVSFESFDLRFIVRGL